MLLCREFERWMEALRENKYPVHDWPIDEKIFLKRQLQPFAEFYERAWGPALPKYRPL